MSQHLLCNSTQLEELLVKKYGFETLYKKQGLDGKQQRYLLHPSSLQATPIDDTNRLQVLLKLCWDAGAIRVFTSDFDENALTKNLKEQLAEAEEEIAELNRRVENLSAPPPVCVPAKMGFLSQANWWLENVKELLASDCPRSYDDLAKVKAGLITLLDNFNKEPVLAPQELSDIHELN